MTKQMSEGQRAYEAKRAARAGMSLDKWLGQKERERAAETRAREKDAAAKAAPDKPPGLLKRLLDRAHKPFGG